jgi:5-methylcytosine-specific restriction endonuclease McrA
MSTALAENIRILRNDGKSYNQICKILNCSKSLVCYYINPEQKSKRRQRQRKNREKLHPYTRKTSRFQLQKRKPTKTFKKNKIKFIIRYRIEKFYRNNQGVPMSEQKFTVDDVIKKFGENPKCYLTGVAIDISKPRTYHFDHIVPTSRGGDNSINNLQICTKAANLAKSNMLLSELYDFCNAVLKHKQATEKGIEPTDILPPV